MEMRVTIKAIKWSWVYMMAFLAAWSIISAVKDSTIPIVQIALILTGELLFFALQWIFTKKEVRNDEDSHSGSKRLETQDKSSYEYVYEDEDGTQYVYEEVEVEE